MVGDGTQTCDEGTWTGSQPTCEPDTDWSDVIIFNYVNTGQAAWWGDTIVELTAENPVPGTNPVVTCYQDAYNDIKWCDGDAMIGRIALRGLPPYTRHMYFCGSEGGDFTSDITQLVEIAGMNPNPFGTGGFGPNYTVVLSSTTYDCPATANPNYIHQCPLDTEYIDPSAVYLSKYWSDYYNADIYAWAFYTAGTPDYCTLPE
jgi:hypothetical protein